MLEGYLMLSGRIRRWRFFVYGLALYIIAPVLILLAIPAIDNARYPRAATFIVVVVLVVSWYWANMALVVKRLHDLNKTGWHYVWMFLVPGLLSGGLSFELSRRSDGHWSVGYGLVVGIVPFLASLYLTFARGSDGPNDYGYPP